MRNAGRATYLDTSAFVKLVLAEPESASLREFLAGQSPRVSSWLLHAEAVRAVRRFSEDAVDDVLFQLEGVTLLDVDGATLRQAASLDPPELRALDAIHLATALRLGPDLGVVVTYDVRMAAGAQALGLPVAAPA